MKVWIWTIITKNHIRMKMMKSRHKVSADLKNSRALRLRGSAIIRSRIYDYRYSSGSMERITSLV